MCARLLVGVTPLPMGLNRTSWKHRYGGVDVLVWQLALPMGLNRTSWKLAGWPAIDAVYRPTDGLKSD